MFDFSQLTPEQRQENLRLAQLKAAEKRDRFKASAHLLQDDFEDLKLWRVLAKQFGIRLPASYIPCSELKHARRAIAKTGINFREINACSLEQWARMNSTWPAYAMVGLILEDGAELLGQESELNDIPDEEPAQTKWSDVEDLI